MMPIPPDRVRKAIFDQKSMVERLFSSLASGSQGNPGIMRDTYGPGESFAHDVLRQHAQERGLRIDVDAAANTVVTWAGTDPAARRVIMGSHLDSVSHGGNFDGAAGVLAGLCVQSALATLGFRPHCDVAVIGIRAEESVWFQISYIGSRSALGTLPDGALDACRVDTGRSLAAHMAECGGDPDAIRRRVRSLDPGGIRAFIEVHIEQAPALVESGLPVAICSGIPGNVRYPFAGITGRHDHVGTPRRFRRDAAMAAADLAMAMDRIWQEHEDAGIPVAITFGRFHTDPSAHGLTIVPGRFDFSLDMRAYDPAVLAGLETQLFAEVAEVERRRGVTVDLGKRAGAQVGMVDPSIAADLAAYAKALSIPTMSLGSPASHDAAAFAEAGVPMAMLLVRNEHGSHNPSEQMEIDDFLEACTLMACWVADHAGAPP
jgi:N-carbamoyl-L-amino-acid hydrolase